VDPGHDREELRHYRRTVLSFEGGPAVDLRSPLGGWERAALADLGLGREFAVLSAENPRGEEPEDASPEEQDERDRENVRRVLRLEEALILARVPFRRVEASSPDGLHRERCVAVALSRPRAEALARAQEQLALFWYDGERFWLWPAEAEAPADALPAP
jgi:uncharacterized protein DUF3293